MKHGVTFDIMQPHSGGKGGMFINGEFIPSKFDQEKIHLPISKPSGEELESLERFKLSSPYPAMADQVRQINMKHSKEDIPLSKWKKRLFLFWKKL